MSIVMVLAMADDGTIGDAGGIPWRLPEDLQRFKAITMGKPLIVGRKTYESFPKRPLPGRTNIVITRDGAYKADGAVVVHSLEAALAAARAEMPSEIVIAGGAEIYKQALPLADRIELTEIHLEPNGATRMPAFDMDAWHETLRQDHATPENLRFSYVVLERR